MQDDTHVAAGAPRTRLQAIDVLRGVVIVLMVLDHTRDFFGDQTIEATDVEHTTPLLFFSRWVTHFCAPTFIFLAGVSARLMRGKLPPAELRSFLLKRGLWLVLLEFTIVRFAWTFDVSYASGPIYQVIWAIGISMCLLAPLTRVSDHALLALGFLLVVAHDLLDPIAPAAFGSWGPLWNLLHVQGRTSLGFVVYPLVPWVGVMPLGYVAGRLYELPVQDRQRWLLGLGAACVVLFVALRALDGYGDPEPWTQQATWVRSALSFVNVSKYPPSLDYVLMNFGPMFLLLCAFERSAGWLSRVFATIGRAPLFAYVGHLLWVHAAAGVVGFALGHGLAMFTQAFFRYPADWGFDLDVVYLVWFLTCVVLYAGCRWFGAQKQAHKTWWMAYL